jgi:hypothetical protein
MNQNPALVISAIVAPIVLLSSVFLAGMLEAFSETLAGLFLLALSAVMIKLNM